MKDFFTYYTEIKSMAAPFQTFSIAHLCFLCLMGIIIYALYHRYTTLNTSNKRKFQIYMALYFLIEEAIYTLWLLLNCHEQVWIQILPLELCSCCVYMNAACVFTQKNSLRFFSGVVGLVAGGLAMIYPANIAGLYPIVSYRTINFYILHGAFLLFSLIQLSDTTLLQYRYMKKNYLIICCMFSIAFIVNLMLDTQYMFVGVPPKIALVASLYQLTGIFLFLPAVLAALFVIQCIVVYLLRKVYGYPSKEEAAS